MSPADIRYVWVQRSPWTSSNGKFFDPSQNLLTYAKKSLHSSGRVLFSSFRRKYALFFVLRGAHNYSFNISRNSWNQWHVSIFVYNNYHISYSSSFWDANIINIVAVLPVEWFRIIWSNDSESFDTSELCGRNIRPTRVRCQHAFFGASLGG